MLTVKYFGAIADKARNNEEEIPFSPISLKQLLNEVEQKHQLRTLSFSVAVNQKMVQNIENVIIKDNDVIALLPPFAGG